VPLLAAASSYSSTPHLIALRWLLWSVCVYRLEPQQTMRRPEELQARMTVGPHGEHLTSVLNTMKQESPERFRNLERAVRAIVPDAEGLEPRINDRGELELWLREHGRDVPARLASDGTLRIIGLLSLSAGEKKHSIIGFEEPENGVHPARLRLLARMLETQMQAEDRQWIVTTHSPILPDLLPTGCLLTCRSRDGHTEVLPFTETEPGRRAAAIREELDPAGPSIEVLMQRGDLG
jgi:predicted ATPase